MPPHIALDALDVPCLGHDLEVALALEQQLQPAAHDDVIVGQHNADRVPGARSRLPCLLVLLRHFCGRYRARR